MTLLTSGPEAAATQDQASAPALRSARFTWRLALWVLCGAAAFHLAYGGEKAGFLTVIYAFALVQLTSAPTWRGAFYSGLLVGLLIAGFRLAFFWRIFSGGAAALWLVYAFWIGLFVALARLCRNRCPPDWGLVILPFLWCGLEYFRSELYYLRFSWLSPGFSFGTAPGIVPVSLLGVYGLGFALMAIACIAKWGWQKSKWGGMAVLLSGPGLLGLAGHALPTNGSAASRQLRVAGVQLEFPTEPDVVLRLTELIRRHPDAELLVLSEYTFNEPVPDSIRTWCRKHQKYLVVGGKDAAPDNNFYDTAFVVSPAGEIVFRQGKRIPIQFFKDGLPAPEQRLWDSPWGRLGFCVCYDLSYSRVTDRLIQLGAEALIVPTMDVGDWGRAQHELHARVAPLRAAEYGVPIFRLASSGISQAVDRSGRWLASAPFPGEAATIFSTLELRGRGRLPWDRYVAPVSSALTGLVCLVFLIEQVLKSICEKVKKVKIPAGA